MVNSVLKELSSVDLIIRIGLIQQPACFGASAVFQNIVHLQIRRKSNKEDQNKKSSVAQNS